MLLPIGPNNRISHLLNREPAYIPLNSRELESKLKLFEWNNLREPIFIDFTPLNQKEIITIKGSLDYSEVSRTAFKMKEQNVNVVFLQFKTDTLTKITGTKEESVRIKGSNTFIIGNEVYTSLILLDGEEKDTTKLDIEACGILNRFGSYNCYTPRVK